MNVIEFDTPVPSCLVPLTHPSNGRRMDVTDISRTIAEHDLRILDDYDACDRLGYLESKGAWK